MVYLKAIQQITPMDVSVSGTIDQKTYLKKCRGASAPLAPLDLPMKCVLEMCKHKRMTIERSKFAASIRGTMWMGTAFFNFRWFKPCICLYSGN